MERRKIRLTPLTRLTFSFNAELNLDANGVFNSHTTYENYIERYLEVDRKQNQLIRSLYTTNAILFLILSGQDWTIPFFQVTISSIPAIQEILLFSAAMGFFFLCAIFVTGQCYVGLINQCGNRIVDNNRVDPDFFNASRKHFDFFLKLYSPKLNIWGVDFYEHGRGFAVFSYMIKAIMLVVVLVFPAVHILLTVLTSIQVYQSELNPYGIWFLLGSVALINFGGLAMVFGMNKEFDFVAIEPPANIDNNSETKEISSD